MLGVSYRQAKRLWQRYQTGGARALRHGLAGRPSNRQLAGIRRRALALIRQKYSGLVTERFGPTLAAEHLASEDGVRVHPETLRRWMLDARLWSRARKAHAGELVQLDGSFHAWFEDRSAVQPCLITLVDDATSQSWGQFSPQETIWAAVAVLRAWIEQHGIPQALYTDWKNVYVRAATAAERAAGLVPRTQFGRMCHALGIRIIPASSPQAKGRIERNHGTHQDRLVKKLRRLGIADLPTANAFLHTTYWPEHNRRFAVAAASSEDMHRRCPTARQLEAVFHLETPRTVGDDWVVRYHNRFFQLERQSTRAPARATVTVCEWPDGRVQLHYRGQLMKWHECAAAPVLASADPSVPRPRPTPLTPRPPRPRPDHPWRKAVATFRVRKTLWQALEN